MEDTNKDLNYLDRRLSLLEVKIEYELTVHKKETYIKTICAILTAFSAAFVSLVDLFISCTCNTNFNDTFLLLLRIFNVIIIALTLYFNLFGTYLLNHIRKLKDAKKQAVKNHIVDQINEYKQKIEKENKILKRLKIFYAVAGFVIAAFEFLLLFLGLYL